MRVVTQFTVKISFELLGLTQNRPSGVAPPCRTLMYCLRRRPCRARLRLHAQTVSQARGVLLETPAQPLLGRFCVSPIMK